MQLSIRNQLIGGFAIFLLFTTIIFFQGRYSLSQLSDRFETIIDREVDRIVYSQRSAELIQLITKREKDFLLEEAVQSKNEYLEEIESKTSEMLAYIDSLKAISDDRGIAILDQFDAEWKKYENAFELLVQKEMEAQQHEDAILLSTTTARVSALEATELLGQLVAKNVEALETAKIEAGERASAANRNMTILLIFSLI